MGSMFHNSAIKNNLAQILPVACLLFCKNTRKFRLKVKCNSKGVSIMPNRPVRDQWEYLRKMERYFPIKPNQPIKMLLIILSPNSLIRAKNRFIKNGTENFGRHISTEISGLSPEVIPNIPVRINRNEPFHLNSDRNFWNLWHNGKHPKFPENMF